MTNIPKKIHYCWFGRNPLPQSALRCIASWKRYFPDYEIIQWNEDNFDIESNTYTSEAYRAGKFAFVSDYARFKILYSHGGIYFDTDVEVLRSFDDILSQGGFMGYETTDHVNPGLGLGTEAGNYIYHEIIKYYDTLPGFIIPKPGVAVETVVQHTTKILRKLGADICNNKKTSIGNITIYPIEWFNPMDSVTGRINKTNNTHSIHLYTKSWMKHSTMYTRFSRFTHRILGTKLPAKIKRMLQNKH